MRSNCQSLIWFRVMFWPSTFVRTRSTSLSWRTRRRLTYRTRWLCGCFLIVRWVKERDWMGRSLKLCIKHVIGKRGKCNVILAFSSTFNFYLFRKRGNSLVDLWLTQSYPGLSHLREPENQPQAEELGEGWHTEQDDYVGVFWFLNGSKKEIGCEGHWSFA